MAAWYSCFVLWTQKYWEKCPSVRHWDIEFVPGPSLLINNALKYLYIYVVLTWLISSLRLIPQNRISGSKSMKLVKECVVYKLH